MDSRENTVWAHSDVLNCFNVDGVVNDFAEDPLPSRAEREPEAIYQRLKAVRPHALFLSLRQSSSQLKIRQPLTQRVEVAGGLTH